MFIFYNNQFVNKENKTTGLHHFTIIILKFTDDFLHKKVYKTEGILLTWMNELNLLEKNSYTKFERLWDAITLSLQHTVL